MKESFNVWKIHIAIKIAFSSSKDNDQYRYIYLQQDPFVFKIGENTGDIVEKILPKSLKKYPEKMVVDINDNGLIFDYVDKTYYHYYEISLNRGGTFTDSRKWLKNKKSHATINPKNINDEEYYKYAITNALCQNEIPIIWKE